MNNDILKYVYVGCKIKYIVEGDDGKNFDIIKTGIVTEIEKCQWQQDPYDPPDCRDCIGLVGIDNKKPRCMVHVQRNNKEFCIITEVSLDFIKENEFLI